MHSLLNAIFAFKTAKIMFGSLKRKSVCNSLRSCCYALIKFHLVVMFVHSVAQVHWHTFSFEWKKEECFRLYYFLHFLTHTLTRSCVNCLNHSDSVLYFSVNSTFNWMKFLRIWSQCFIFCWINLKILKILDIFRTQ